MKCKIGEAIEKIENLIDKPAIKNSADTLAELERVKRFLNSAREIKMSKIQSSTSPEFIEFQKENNNEYDSELDTSIANKLKSIYKDIEVIYLSGQNEMRAVLEELGGDIALFQLSKKRKEEFEKKLRKARPELDNTSLDKILSSIEEFSETEANGNEKLMKKLELLALHWTIKGNVILPEDSEKVMSALKIADKNKFDPFNYDSPNDINNAFSPISEKESTIDPDTFLNKGFSNKREIGNGVVTYDVANTETGRESSRKIMDSHYDTNFNPWCLLFRDSYGLTENSSKMWYEQYPGNKKIAFKDGKLISFYGGDKWWDIHDAPHKGIPIINRGKFIEGENRVRESSIVDENDANKVIAVNGYELGVNKPGNEYKKWDKDKNLLLHITKDGTKIATDFDGKISTLYPDGSGIIVFSNGKIHKKVLKDGSFTTWNEDGNVIAEYKVEKGYTKWFSNGTIKETGDSPYSDNNVKIYYEDGSLYEEKIDYTTYKRYDKKGFLVDVSYPNKYRLNGLDYLGSVSYNSENTEKTIIVDYSERKFDKYIQKTVVSKDGTIKIYKKNSDDKVDEIIYPDGSAEMYDTRGRIIQTISKDGEIEVKKYGILDNIKSFIGFQKTDDIIKGAAVINKKKILIDIENRSTDTLAHEYAHFYIAAFRDTPIVQEAIKKWGNEEALVQAIGEQVVKQKGEVYNWWKQFSKWIKDLFGSLNKATKEELVQLLTDAFLTNRDISAETKMNDDGSITVATLDGVYTFENGSENSRNTYKGKSVSMPIMKDIEMQASAELSGFTVPFNVLSSQANKWASDYLVVGLSEKAGGVLKPLVMKAHAKAKQKNSMYRKTVNLIAEGYRDSELLAKIRVMLKVTGDIDDKKLAEVMTVAYNNARMTKEVLDTKLPELDKWIKRELRDAKDRKNLNDIFGRSGFMHLMDNPDVIGALYSGETDVDKLIAKIPASKLQMEEAEALKEYLIEGKVSNTGRTNGNGSKTVEQLAALLALKDEGRMDTLVKLRSKHLDLYEEMLMLSGMVKSLHEVVYSGRRNAVGTGSGRVYTGYDSHGMMDVYEGTHEYKYVTKEELNGVLKDPRWKVIRTPEKDVIGIVARESLNSYQEGIGLDKDVIRNGIALDKDFVESNVLGKGAEWLAKNNIVSDTDNGYTRYRVVLTAEERSANGYMDNVAHTLYRTWVHNAQVVEMQTVQGIVTESMTAQGETGLKDMEATIKRNNMVDADRRREVKPFLDMEISYEEMKEKYPEVYKRYTPVKNISNYADMRRKVTYVRKDMEDILIGYSTGSIFKDDSTFGVGLQRIETVYKQLVQMLKLKLVVANPAKLAMDTLSNTTLLMSMDVGIDEIAKGFPKALKYANEMSGIESRLVVAKIGLARAEATGKDTRKAKAEVEAVMKEMERHPFYPAIKNGFIQSQGTSMLVKEYDTISGLQKTIDDVVKMVVADEKGNPNKMHAALVWMMNAGFGIDDILNSVSNMSKVKGTTFGEELEGIAKRLEEKKGKDVIRAEEKRLGRKLTEDEIREIEKDADTVRYVSEFIAAPSSELVRQGSRVMQMADIMSRWTMYTHEMSKGLKEIGYTYENEYKAQQDIKAGKLDKAKYDKIESDAAIKALDTFIDYRMNMPREVKMLSDLGVLMFPAFWIRAQKVIYNLAKYHPVNAGAGLLLTDMLGLNGASIVDANFVNKMMNGTLVQGGQNVLDPGTVILGL